MGQFGIGQAVRRVEDVRFVTGHGQYTDDITLPDQAYGVVLRSPHAHAEIRAIDVSAAREAPGVLAVFTGADIAAAGLGDLPCLTPVKNRDGSAQRMTQRALLARDRVRYVGEPVAFIVAESVAAGEDAAELIEVEYEQLPAVGTIEAAIAAGAPQIYDHAPGNIAFDWQDGDPEGVAEAFGQAAHRVVFDFVQNRVVANPMETRNACAAYDPESEGLTLYTSSQGVHSVRGLIAKAILKIPEQRLRVVTPDVGGGFGMKLQVYPEQCLTLFAARATGRPVKWTAERSEAFVSDLHGRDLMGRAELALDAEGRILAMRVSNHANLGGYLSQYGPMMPTLGGGRVLGGVYDIPKVHFQVKGVFTNSAPVDAYRGAGRPEMIYVTERVIDAAARQIGMDQAEFRRRNFIRPEQLPYTNWRGIVFDSGDFARNLDDALRIADWAGFEARRAESARYGRLRGIGIAYYVEITGAAPGEAAEITFQEDGTIEVLLGTQSNGQGHQTSFAQVLADRLGVPFERVRIVQGDSARIPTGGGTGGSRSLHVSAGAINVAAGKIEEKGKLIAAHLLEAAPADIEFTIEEGEGRFRIAGTDRAVSILDVARASRARERLPDEVADQVQPGLTERGAFEPEASTLPNGCHICELEIDPDTGMIAFENYTVVDDFGRVINPMIVEGQVQGGIAQGIGQALLENCLYDPESGQLLTGSFMDYCMPRADDLPVISFTYNEIPCRTNPYGVKGCGEAGTVGALAAVMNAVLDALSPAGVTRIDMPATPERIWRALQEARAPARAA